MAASVTSGLSVGAAHAGALGGARPAASDGDGAEERLQRPSDDEVTFEHDYRTDKRTMI